MQIPEKDQKIIVELRKDARAQLTQISKQTGIPISTIFDKLRNKLGGAITRHVALLDFEALGFTTRAHICLKCAKSTREKTYNMLVNHHNINSLYKINNGYDFLIEGIFKNIREVEEFNERLEEEYNVRTKQIFYIIDEIAREQFYADQIHAQLTKKT